MDGERALSTFQFQTRYWRSRCSRGFAQGERSPLEHLGGQLFRNESCSARCGRVSHPAYYPESQSTYRIRQGANRVKNATALPESQTRARCERVKLRLLDYCSALNSIYFKPNIVAAGCNLVVTGFAVVRWASGTLALAPYSGASASSASMNDSYCVTSGLDRPVRVYAMGLWEYPLHASGGPHTARPPPEAPRSRSRT